jgi:hypothetical protein
MWDKSCAIFRNKLEAVDRACAYPVSGRTQRFFMEGGFKIFILSDNGKLKYTINYFLYYLLLNR